MKAKQISLQFKKKHGGAIVSKKISTNRWWMFLAAVAKRGRGGILQNVLKFIINSKKWNGFSRHYRRKFFEDFHEASPVVLEAKWTQCLCTKNETSTLERNSSKCLYHLHCCSAINALTCFGEVMLSDVSMSSYCMDLL